MQKRMFNRTCSLCVLFISLVLLLVWSAFDVNRRSEFYEELSLDELIEYVVIGNSYDSQNAIGLVKMDDGKYAAFLPNDMNEKTKIWFKSFKMLRLDSQIEFRNGDCIGEVVEEKSYKAELIGWNNKVRAEIELNIFRASGIPSVYIRTNSKSTELIDGDKTLMEEAQIFTVDVDGDKVAECSCEISTRGHSSFSQNQKPYNVDCKNAISLLGMEKGKKWSLIANYSDGMQQVRNKFTYDIAQRFGLKYSPDSRFCNVYIDGQYRGMYLMVRKNTIDDAYSFEMSSRYYDELIHFPTAIGYPIVLENPDDFSDDEIVNCALYVRDAVDVLADNKSSDEEVEKFIDYDSWSRYYVMQGFATQYDLEFDSFKFYKYRNAPLLYAGPVWDFDLAYGKQFFCNCPQLMQRTMWIMDDRDGWLSRLGKKSGFEERVKRNYLNEFLPIVKEYLEKELTNIVSDNESSYYMNCYRWNRTREDYRKAANDLRQWIVDRCEFLSDYVDSQGKYCKVTFDFGEQELELYYREISYYVRKGEKIGFLPLEENGEYDERFGSIVGWKDEGGNTYTTETVIDEDIILYAVTEDVSDGK